MSTSSVGGLGDPCSCDLSSTPAPKVWVSGGGREWSCWGTGSRGYLCITHHTLLCVTNGNSTCDAPPLTSRPPAYGWGSDGFPALMPAGEPENLSFCLFKCVTEVLMPCGTKFQVSVAFLLVLFDSVQGDQ